MQGPIDTERSVSGCIPFWGLCGGGGRWSFNTGRPAPHNTGECSREENVLVRNVRHESVSTITHHPLQVNEPKVGKTFFSFLRIRGTHPNILWTPGDSGFFGYSLLSIAGLCFSQVLGISDDVVELIGITGNFYCQFKLESSNLNGKFFFVSLDFFCLANYIAPSDEVAFLKMCPITRSTTQLTRQLT